VGKGALKGVYGDTLRISEESIYIMRLSYMKLQCKLRESDGKSVLSLIIVGPYFAFAETV
jgi:hypothetical protein